MAADELQALLALLDIETIDTDLHRGQPTTGRRSRVYGGQVAGQALVAAGRTVPEDRAVHSLHAYFMRPGDATIPIVYDVDRLRDGRSFTTRRVRASQRGQAIFTLEASFHVDEPPGLVHQPELPEVPPPDGLPSLRELVARATGSADRLGEINALDFRVVPREGTPPARGDDVPSRYWFRAEGLGETDRLVVDALLTYASDVTLLANILLRHGRYLGDPGIQVASLDHAMWFHAHGSPRDWLLYEITSPAAGGGRGLGFGRIYRADGTLVASAAQEGLVRLVG